jgi:predicted dehydrogenase
MPEQRRIAIIGLGMAVTPHTKSLLDLRDRVEVAHAYSRSAARRGTFAERFDFPLERWKSGARSGSRSCPR